MSSFRADSMSTACGVALIDNEIPSDQARSAANRSLNSNGSGHSREVNFFSAQWMLERRGKFLEKIAALVIDLDCARQLAGSALWGSAPELLNI